MTFPDFPLLDENIDEPGISFFAEDVAMPELDVPAIEKWIEQTIERESAQLGALNFIFCSDNYLLEINQEYLQHDTYTDIITFPYTHPPAINGDIYISTDRTADNAASFGVTPRQELMRVIIHGVLHLCGYEDKTPEDKAKMTEKENEALSVASFLL